MERTDADGRFRFVDASELRTDPVDFRELTVRSVSSQERLGTLRGFVVDADRGQLQYVAVDSGGWFTGGTYLIPPAYTRIDADEQVFWAEVTRDTISHFPEFDPKKFPTLSDAELWTIERRIIEAYGDDPGVVAPTADWDRATWPHYGQPPWWRDEYAAARRQPVPPGRTDVVPSADTPTPGWPDAAGDRAQPGDVLGIERGGETTSLGDTSESEDARRQRAEDAMRDGTAVEDQVADGHREQRRRSEHHGTV